MIKDYFNPNAPKHVWQNMWIVCGAIATAALVSIAFAQAKSEKVVWPEEWTRQSWPTAHYDISVRVAENQSSKNSTQAVVPERFVQIKARVEAGEVSHGVIYQTIKADSLRGKTIRFSAKTRTYDVASGYPLLEIYFLNEAGMPVHGESTSAIGSRIRIDWRENYMIVKVPTEAHAMAYGVRMTGKGTIDMKDVAITEMPDGTRVTNDRSKKGNTMIVKLGTPTNLDFK